MAEITLFTAPKAFTNPHIDMIQRNAIRNWLALAPQVEVLIMGREQGMQEVAAELGVRYVPEVRCSEAGPPFISSMYDLARELTASPFLAITNADILFFPDLVTATLAIAQQRKKFLILGKRYDLDLQTDWDFSTGWETRLWDEVKLRGKRHPPTGSDYFIFPRELFTGIPDFTIGRSAWDNWMIAYAMQQGWPVIDASHDLRIVHQNHDYSHLPGNRPPYKLPETKRNIDLAGGEDKLKNILDIPELLVGGRIQKSPLTVARVVYRFEMWITPKGGKKNGLRWQLTRQVRRFRRKLTGEVG
jgi:hypothetical protein